MKKIIIIILVLIALGAAGYYAYGKLNETKPNTVVLEEVNIEKDAISVTCFERGRYGSEALGADHPKIDPGMNVTCTFFLNNPTYEDMLIKKINMDYKLDGDIESYGFFKMGMNYKDDGGHLVLSTSKNFVIDKMEKDGETETGSGASFIELTFTVRSLPSEDKVKINLNNIVVENDTHKYYINDFTREFDVQKDTVYAYKFSKDDNSITFYKDNGGYKQINTYACKGECYVYAAQCFSYVDLENGKLFINDDEKAILYDINKGVIGEYATPLYNIYDTSTERYTPKYFVAKKTKDGKSAILDFDGNIIKDYVADAYGTVRICDIRQDNYSVANNMVVMKKDGKYGITRITSDEVVTDYQFDNIRIYNSKYYIAKLDNKWYLYNFDNTKAIDEGYTEIFMPRDDILVVQKDDYLYIKDYTGKNLTEEKMKVLSPYNENACCGTSSGISVFNDSSDNNLIYIYVDNGKPYDKGFVEYQYIYDIKNNVLGVKLKKDS